MIVEIKLEIDSDHFSSQEAFEDHLQDVKLTSNFRDLEVLIASWLGPWNTEILGIEIKR